MNDDNINITLTSENINNFFIEACRANDLEKVKFYLTSSNLAFHADIDSRDYNQISGFTYACAWGHINIVQYLLTSPELEKHADIVQNKGEPLRTACANSQLSVIQYLLTSPELSIHADLLQDNCMAFEMACMTGNMDVLNYIIFNFPLIYLPTMQEYFTKDPELETIYKTKEFYNSLQDSLSVNNELSKKNKI